MATLRDWRLFNRFRRWCIQCLLDRKSESLVEITKTFPAFVPCSAGSYETIARLTLSSINQCLPNLGGLAVEVASSSVHRRALRKFPKSPAESEAAERLSRLFDAEGSDKGAELGYANLYGPLLSRKPAPRSILEIGLGSTHTDTASHVSPHRKTGGSLRALRAFCPSADIFGADVDRRILFEEERIRTFFVDQTDPASFDALGRALPPHLDLIIDDGLHSPEANLNTLRFALPRLAPGGWCVIEDIGGPAGPLWVSVAALLSLAGWQPCLLESPRALLFAVQKSAVTPG